jgi:hypothetical protein
MSVLILTLPSDGRSGLMATILAGPIAPAAASDQEIKSCAVEAKLGHPCCHIWDDLGYIYRDPSLPTA